MKLLPASILACFCWVVCAETATAQFATGGNYASSNSGTSGSRGAMTGSNIINYGGFPVGTQTSGKLGTTFGGAYSGGLGGVTYGNRGFGQTSLFNVPGFGYFSGSPYASQFPQYTNYGSPVGGGAFPFGGLGAQNGYWLSPSGYYYPFYPVVYQAGSSYPSAPPIYEMRNGAPAEAKPSVSAMLNDMRQFVEIAKGKHQLDQSNYEYVSNRINSIAEEAANLGAKNSGVLDSQDEVTVRRELDLLSADIARALNP